MTSVGRDSLPFLAVAVGLVVTLGAFLTIDRTEPDLLTGVRMFIGLVGAVITIQALRSALRWNRPVTLRPSAPGLQPNAAGRAATSDDRTFGTGSVGSDMAASSTFIVGGPGTGMVDLGGTAQTGMTADIGSDSGGGDAGGGDTSGGGDSGGSSS